MSFFSYFPLQNSLTIANDPSTSDDSGRASERLTTSSVAPRDADSSRDRLSDVSILESISSCSPLCNVATAISIDLPCMAMMMTTKRASMCKRIKRFHSFLYATEQHQQQHTHIQSLRCYCEIVNWIRQKACSIFFQSLYPHKFRFFLTRQLIINILIYLVCVLCALSFQMAFQWDYRFNQSILFRSHQLFQWIENVPTFNPITSNWTPA